MDYRLKGLGSISSRGKVLLTSIASWPALGPIQPNKWVLETLSMGAYRPRHEADHSSPSRADGKKGGAVPSLPNVFMAKA
jgi:hypothetical protein